MKTHLTWFGIALVALIAGMYLAKKEVRVVEKPVEIVKTKEVFIERPARDGKAPVLVDRPVERVVDAPGGVGEVGKISRLPVDSRNSAEESRLHQRYDSFLAQVGLTPAQADRFVELKISIFEVQDDLQAAGRQAGIPGGSDEVEAMRSKLTKPMWDEIRQLLGKDGFNAYGDFERMSAVLPTVESLFRSVAVPVSKEQADQIARSVIKNTETYRANATDISLRTRVDWGAVAREAEGTLSPAQIEVISAKAVRDAAR